MFNFYSIGFYTLFGCFVRKSFLSQESCETYCRQIGRKDLIDKIEVS